MSFSTPVAPTGIFLACSLELSYINGRPGVCFILELMISLCINASASLLLSQKAISWWCLYSSHLIYIRMPFSFGFRSSTPTQGKFEDDKSPEVNGGFTSLSISTNPAVLAVAALVVIQVCVGILFKAVQVHDT